MDLRRLDLNLLVALDALLRVRHVTRAAQLLGIGQSGMSAALARLRQAFGDPLLVKQGGGLRPTARAAALEPEIRRVLRDVERLVTDQPVFDPASARRGFALRMSDMVCHLMLPALVRRIRAEAPGVTLRTTALGPDATVDALERDDVELALSTDLAIPKSVAAATLYEDRVVVVARRDHPQRRALRTLESFLQLPQIKIAQSPIDDRFADRQLAAAGHRRRIALALPHWTVVADVVAASDLIAIMPESFAATFARDRPIVLVTPPFASTAFTWSLYWHRRYTADAGHAWLRRVVQETAAGLRTAGAPR
jgi:DNA-binding transcriptional LysR family regulator